MTLCTDSSFAVTNDTANFASFLDTFSAALICSSCAFRPSTLSKGTIVTLFCNCPRSSKDLPVSAESTTTWYNFPPAMTSNAVVVDSSSTSKSLAIVPLTFARSNLLSGFLNLKSRPASFPVSWSHRSRASSRSDSKDAFLSSNALHAS